MCLVRCYHVSYFEDGQSKDRYIRDRKEADKVKKIKKGSIRPIYVEMNPKIR